MILTQEPPTKVDGLIDGIKPDESGGINRFTENKSIPKNCIENFFLKMNLGIRVI